MPDLDVQAQGGIIVVTDPKTGFYAVYDKSTAAPELHLRSRAETTDHALLARAWQAANAKVDRVGVNPHLYDLLVHGGSGGNCPLRRFTRLF
jgi:hypothetical protein